MSKSNDQNNVIVDDGRFRLVYLHSSPLVEGMVELPLLNIDAEIARLKKAFIISNRQISFRVEVATPYALRAIAIQGCVMVHYSGHGIVLWYRDKY